VTGDGKGERSGEERRGEEGFNTCEENFVVSRRLDESKILSILTSEEKFFSFFSSKHFMALSVMTNTFKYYYFWYLLCQALLLGPDDLNGLLISTLTCNTTFI